MNKSNNNNNNNNNHNNSNNNFTTILYKENEFLRNKVQILNQQNTSLYNIIHDMKELMVKFEHFPKLINYLESSINDKDIEYLNLKKKYDEEFYRLNEMINKQIEGDDIEKKKREDIIDGLKKTIEDIENQKYIDSNEYENQLIEFKGRINNLLEKEKEYLKTQSDLIAEKEWITKSKANEIITIENSKKEIEKQLNEITNENEHLKKQITNYQQSIKLSQQRQLNNNSNGTHNGHNGNCNNIGHVNGHNPYLVISPSSTSSSSSTHTDEYQLKSNILVPINKTTTSTTNNNNNNNNNSSTSNHLSSHNKKAITITKKSNWEYK